MKPAPFEYLRPSSTEEALVALGEHAGSVRVLAGGQSLMPMMGMRIMRPATLIDINRLGEELGRIEMQGTDTVIGALVRYSELERSPIIAERLPLLQTLVRHIGDRQVRNRGTIGGAVAQSDPVGEMALAAVALRATVLVRSTRSAREIPAGEFFTGSYENTLSPDELLVGLRFGNSPAHHVCFERARKHNDFAVVSMVAGGDRAADGSWSRVYLALGGVNDRPVLAHSASLWLEGQVWDTELIAEAAELALEVIDPPDDVRASAEYRRHLVQVYVRRLLAELEGAGQNG